MTKTKKWLLVAMVFIVILVTGMNYLYINYVLVDIPHYPTCYVAKSTYSKQPVSAVCKDYSVSRCGLSLTNCNPPLLSFHCLDNVALVELSEPACEY